MSGIVVGAVDTAEGVADTVPVGVTIAVGVAVLVGVGVCVGVIVTVGCVYVLVSLSLYPSGLDPL